ncbi:MAG TPA: alpha/beta hydrolase family protein [Steroidobacteraceae bacterium]|jgi:pimeloyl-ACP methyl ester carboxylesterase|nr:alpha/beta hydrolase family protein [Steroidobacteraceae bacterium]
MRPTAPDEWEFRPSALTEESLYFRAADRQLFGWLHRAAAAPAAAAAPGRSAEMGVVICKPFGYEATCAHRSLGAFAQAAAAAGFPTLRFDYAGTGDSGDIDPSADQLALWTEDVVAAVHELQRRSGVGQVCLLGFRFGALLATLAARRCPAVTALIAVAPVLSGRRYLRELRVIQMAASKSVVVAPRAATLEEGKADSALEVSGFSISASSTAALSRLDLSTLAAPPVAHVLVIDRSDLPGARVWADALGKLGVQAEYVALPGIVEMMWTAPHFAKIPHAMISAVRGWLERRSRELGATAAEPAAPATAASAAPVLRLGDKTGAADGVSERPVFISTDPMVFGIVTEPARARSSAAAAILLNDGATSHIGANGLYVSLARKWAQRGCTVLRMDLAGLGDSGIRRGRPGNEVFPPAALDDLRAAIDHLRRHYGVQQVTIAGLCAGAYHALCAALEPLPINRLMMINPQVYYWKEGMSIDDLQLADIVRKRALSTHWQRLLAGQVNIWKVVNIYLRRPFLSLQAALRDAARRLHIRLPRDLGQQLEDLAARGVRIVFAFSRDDTGIELLRLSAGAAIKRCGAHIHIIDGADHIFSQSGPRQELERVLSVELFAATPTSAASRH